MLTIDVNSAPVTSALQQLQQRMQNLQPALEEMGNELEKRIQARFETFADPSGHPWPQWAAITKRRYPTNGRGKLLQRTGDMLGDLSWQANSTTLRVGFAHDYASAHEFGAPQKNLPRRGLLFADPQSGTLAPADEAALHSILSDWLAQDL